MLPLNATCPCPCPAYLPHLVHLLHPAYLQCPLTFDPSRGESSCSESRRGICFIIIVINANGYSIVVVVLAAAVNVFSVFHFWSGFFLCIFNYFGNFILLKLQATKCNYGAFLSLFSCATHTVSTCSPCTFHLPANN